MRPASTPTRRASPARRAPPIVRFWLGKLAWRLTPSAITNLMQRRRFVTAATAALGVAASEAPAETTARNQYFLLRCYYMRSGPQVDRTTRFLSSAYLPAAKRTGAKTLGFFSP